MEEKDKASWLLLLTAAVNIYLGTMTGFFNISGDLDTRRKEMNDFMCEFLIKNLKLAIMEVKTISTSGKSSSYEVKID